MIAFTATSLSPGCVIRELALHGLAAYLLNGLQQCSSLQSRRKQRWRLTLHKI